MVLALDGHQLILAYYTAFNERRLDDAASMFAQEAELKTPAFEQSLTGPDAYRHFAASWLDAFPDAHFAIQRVEQRGDTICEVDILATGTHRGRLKFDTLGSISPRGIKLMLRFRELLEIRHGTITYSSLEFDVHHLVQQLTAIP
jgi:predicted ester cyclase